MEEEDKSKDVLSGTLSETVSDSKIIKSGTRSKDLRNRKIKLEIIARENIIKMRKEKEELK